MFQDNDCVLVIAPHADDEVIGCGATIAKLASNGHEVHVLVLTNASIGAPEHFTPNMIDSIRAEAVESHRILGVKETLFSDLPAPALDQYPSYKIADLIYSCLVKIRPKVVFIPSYSDLHLDHVITHRASLVALRAGRGIDVPVVLSYEVLSETDCYGASLPRPFSPNFFVDVTDYIEKKIEAFSAFKSQIQAYPNSRSIESVRALAQSRGAPNAIEFAESFFVEKIIS